MQSQELWTIVYADNGRLSTPLEQLWKDLVYRLGYITGEFKTFETEEDLLKIAKEIYTAKRSIGAAEGGNGTKKCNFVIKF